MFEARIEPPSTWLPLKAAPLHIQAVLDEEGSVRFVNQGETERFVQSQLLVGPIRRCDVDFDRGVVALCWLPAAMSEQKEVAVVPAGLDTQTLRRLEKTAAAIRRSLLAGTRSYLEVGRQLIEAKVMLPHGHFAQWVADNCGFTLHSAQNFMNAASFVEKRRELDGLDQTAIILLSAPRLDPTIRERVIEAIKGGMTKTKAIQQMVKMEKEATNPNRGLSDESEENVSPQLRELASIIVGGLAESDLDRVRSIIDGIHEPVSCLALLLG